MNIDYQDGLDDAVRWVDLIAGNAQLERMRAIRQIPEWPAGTDKIASTIFFVDFEESSGVSDVEMQLAAEQSFETAMKKSRDYFDGFLDGLGVVNGAAPFA